MGITYRAEEVFEMAEQIERNGAKFYRRAAELNSVPENQQFLEELAVMEDDHQATFAEMRKSLSGVERGSAGYDPDEEAQLFLDALANSHGGEGDPVAAQELTGEESMEEIIKTAMDLEKHTILFYRSIIENVPAEYGGDKIENIIEEEKSHLVTLAGKLKEL